MRRLLIETGTVITGGPSPRVIRGGALALEGGRIFRILDRGALRRFRATPEGRRFRRMDLKNRVAIPGFVQPHVHLCQTLARGTADDRHLMSWLTEKIFPYEAALTRQRMRQAARRGLAELLSSGTTCIMDMGSIRHTDVIGEELLASGIRAYFGKCLMDRNGAFPALSEPREQAIRDTTELARTWHGREGRIRYAFTPRFILSCSDELMKEAFALLTDFEGTLFHTHASEHPVEVDAVYKRYRMRNIEVLERLGVLGERTCLAHCVHADENELELLRSRGVHVMHCPSANLKLASGIANVTEMLKRGISVSIASDGAACNNRLDIWEEMRLASLLQNLKHGAGALPARKAFELATWGGACALRWQDQIGSLEEGKSSDVVWLDLDRPFLPVKLETDDDYFTALVYSGRPDLVTDVMVAGNWIVRNSMLRTWN
ncbi:MAG: amidohydrolase family protein [Pseudomonadota bacterium]